VAAFGGVFYAIFGSGELQPWAIQDPGKYAKGELEPDPEDPPLNAINEGYQTDQEVEDRSKED